MGETKKDSREGGVEKVWVGAASAQSERQKGTWFKEGHKKKAKKIRGTIILKPHGPKFARTKNKEEKQEKRERPMVGS